MNVLHKLKCSFVVTILLCTLVTTEYSVESSELATDPEMNMNIMKLISSKGYPVEVHEVTTADGYILTLLRIPPFKQKQIPNNCNQTPVIIMHGLFHDSASWVINYPNQSLGFILADKGYDVFLGNMRGTRMSRRHRNLTAYSPEFWRFGLDDIAMYDLPAMIDAVLKITEKDQLMYIGFSQGTTVAFILLSQSPIYNKKIILFVALAPVTTLNHATNSLLRNIIPFFDIISPMFLFLQKYEFNIESLGVVFLERMMCSIQGDSNCKKFIFEFYDIDPQQVNMTMYPFYEKQLFSSTSMNVLEDFAEMQKSGNFRKYDHGWIRNIFAYYRMTPPEYDVTKITTPIVLVWADNDNISDPRDVRSLQEKLRNVVWSYQVTRKRFGHGDYILALDVKETLYDPLLSRTCNYLIKLSNI